MPTLIEHLAKPAHWPNADPADVRTVYRFMVHWRHLSYADRQKETLSLYCPFNPDRDTTPVRTLSEVERQATKDKLLERIEYLLIHANYVEIEREHLEKVIFPERNPYGVDFDIDLDEYKLVKVFKRRESKQDFHPSWANRVFLGAKPVPLITYDRVYILFELKSIEEWFEELLRKDGMKIARRKVRIAKKRREAMPENAGSGNLHLKVFKEIPLADLEMLFPTTEVRLNVFRKWWFGLSFGGGMGGVVAKVVLASIAPLFIVMLLGSVIVGKVMQLFRMRSRCRLQISQSLYFHSLANNAGALTLLAQRGEEEDLKEEMLLYTKIAQSPIRMSDLEATKSAIEAYLLSTFNVTVDFDAKEALGRLLRDGIVAQETGLLRALPPATALTYIDEKWDDYLDQIWAEEKKK